jgi:hypothetical protein
MGFGLYWFIQFVPRTVQKGGLSRGGQDIIHLLKHLWPRLLVLVLRGFILKAGVRKSQLRSGSVWREFDGDYSLSPLRARRSGNPGDLHEPITLQGKKPSIVWMALTFVVRLPKERLFTSAVISTVPGTANQRSICSVHARNRTPGAARIVRSTVS